ncbi:hypothetical protein [Candidatus Poriferisodalis sp.]|uniref:hypothetical protein n=1 Tax=Candidatus Poriferisodalis sp. TaxID=3101277 RepID=UPI003C6F4A9A
MPQNYVRGPAQASAVALQKQIGQFSAQFVNEWRVHVDPTEILNSEHLAALIENGWYLPLSAPESDLCAAAELFQHDPAGANGRMCQLVTNQIDRIERDVVQGFPNRAAILHDAFAAHREQQFNLSVPVFFTQIDGFWHDRCKRSLFHGDIEEIVAAAQGDQVEGGLIERLLEALKNPRWKMKQSEGQRAVGFSELNRHQVLHGEVTDYGAEENSLKAIALLHFSSVILPSPEE